MQILQVTSSILFHIKFLIILLKFNKTLIIILFVSKFEVKTFYLHIYNRVKNKFLNIILFK